MTNRQGTQLGMAQQLREKVQAVLQKGIEQGVFPGASVGIVLPNFEEVFVSAGTTPHTLVTQDTVYDVASITKSVVTSTIALIFLEKGWLKLTDRVHIFRGPEPITIHHLLTHTLDFSLTLSVLKDASVLEIIEAVQYAELKKKPGSSYAYVNASSILLGFELELLSLKRGLPGSLDELAQQFIFGPLGMENSWLGKVPEEVKKQTAPTEIDTWRGGEVLGEVHDESAWKLLHTESGSIYSGAAGLFTTASDLVLFLRAYMQGKVISKEMLAKCAQDQRQPLGTTHNTPIGLGWELAQRHWMGDKVSSQTIGKTGFTGSCVAIDLQNSFAVALLCNHIYPHRPTDRSKINQFRQELINTVAECIV